MHKQELPIDGDVKRIEKEPEDVERYYWNFIMRSGKVIKVGECVYLERDDDDEQQQEDRSSKATADRCDIFRITHLYKDNKGDKFIYGFHYFRASQTVYKPNKRFYQNEVFEVAAYKGSAEISEIRGFCVVLRMAEFLKGMPLGVKAGDIYICDQSFHKTFRKQYKQVKTADGKRKNIPVEGSITGYNTKYDRLKLTSNYQVCLKDTNFQTRTLSKRDVPSRIYYVDNGKVGLVFLVCLVDARISCLKSNYSSVFLDEKRHQSGFGKSRRQDHDHD